MEIKNNIKRSILLKIFAIGFLALILLIPTGMIRGLISERADRKNEAIREVSQKWGARQTIAGPVLTIPYTRGIEKIQEKNSEITKEIITEEGRVNFLPHRLDITGNLETNILKRGIYDITTYNSKLVLSGEFNFPEFSETRVDDKTVINWEEAYITISLTDLKALQQNLELTWNDRVYLFKPGYKNEDLRISMMGAGLNAKVPVDPNLKPDKISFSLLINLNGSESINFIPLGSETNIDISSNWPAPSFSGSFLPDERSITDNGFSAKWKVLELNRAFPQKWESTTMPDFTDSSFGVDLLILVDEYQKNERSAKYAIMFIALTFIVFFFVEVLNRIRIHPVQYILVGLSLVLFFSLLISITEHLNFNMAYLISSVATILLVTLYTRTIFKENRLTLVQGGILTIIYIFIYSIIQLEDYALLMGSIGLFVVLAIVMFISRKINWYEIGVKENKE